MRRDPKVVKKLADGAEVGVSRRDFRRHLSGYELGLVTVGMVLTFALLALPRASTPATLPLPHIDRAEARRDAQSERQLAEQTASQGLPFEVRALGESIRHFGRSATQGLDTSHDREDIRERLKGVLAKGQEPLLLPLRAVQTQFFLQALAQFERDGKQNTELDELGADFVAQAKRNGWFTPGGHCLADEAERRALFRMHWANLIERRDAFPFAPSLNEWRIYYHFLLLHPELRAGFVGAEATDMARVRVVRALARKDPDYPENFASGYLFYRLGENEAAATAFRAHLGRHESGPYALLARNYLIDALQNVASPESP